MFNRRDLYQALNTFLKYEVRMNGDEAQKSAKNGFYRFFMGIDMDSEKLSVGNSLFKKNIKIEEMGYCHKKSSEIRRLYVSYKADTPVAFYNAKGEIVEASGRCTTYFDNDGQPYGTKRNKEYVHEAFEL